MPREYTLKSFRAPVELNIDYEAELNAQQFAAVSAPPGPALVLAGAGAGKTRTLTYRVAYLLEQGIPVDRILLLTFTNKAAREMMDRVQNLIGGDTAGLWGGTFHSVGHRVLRRHAEAVGYPQSFTIMDRDDAKALMSAAIDDAGIDTKAVRFPKPDLVCDILSMSLSTGLPLGQVMEERYSYFDTLTDEIAQAHAAYTKRKVANGVMDFDDLLNLWLRLLRENKEIRESFQARFQFILVDEYQDTNQVQCELIDLLGGRHHNIMAVGDDSQSIYSWRGAEVANILKFEKDFPGAKVIKLEQNYRSTPHILGAASGLIGENSQRLGKELWTETDTGEKVRVIGVWDGPEEARRVGEEIESLERGGVGLDEIAILVRAQYQTREFEDRFIQIGMAYRIVGGFRFYERAEIRDALAYLRVIAQPADDLAFERIYNQPKRGLGAKTLEKMYQHARRTGMPLAAASLDLADSDELPARARGTIGGLLRQFLQWREQADSLAPAELLRQVLEESGYQAMLENERTPEAKGRLENLSELARAMEDYETLGDFLEHVALVMDNDANAEDAKVTIMTIHAAKGLEFDHLFLVGWEEGVFPSQRSLDEGGLASLEEERRLAYVAITRAKKACTILHAANRRIYGQWTSSLPSRFIGELPEDHVESETTMSGGASLWRANWSESEDPFAHVTRDRPERSNNRGPGWQRALATGYETRPARVQESRRSAASFAAKPRDDIALGARVFHDKFGYGTVMGQEGNKLEIEFETTGTKRVIDSFVKPAD